MSQNKKIDGMFLKLPHVEMRYKLEWDAFLYELDGKMFAMMAQNKIGTPILTLKLPPMDAAVYREHYDFICEGYYMNKLHWISVAWLEATDALLEKIIQESYDHFYNNLTKKVKMRLESTI